MVRVSQAISKRATEGHNNRTRTTPIHRKREGVDTQTPLDTKRRGLDNRQSMADQCIVELSSRKKETSVETRRCRKSYFTASFLPFIHVKSALLLNKTSADTRNTRTNVGYRSRKFLKLTSLTIII